MSQRELARFLQISAASSSELEYQLRLAHDYGLLDTRASDRMSERTIEVRRMLIGLIRKVRNDAAVSAET
jgi:four helix bundle protein